MFLVAPERFEEESKERFSLPSRVGTRAVKEEEALVRTVRVVRGSGNSKGVSPVVFGLTIRESPL